MSTRQQHIARARERSLARRTPKDPEDRVELKLAGSKGKHLALVVSERDVAWAQAFPTSRHMRSSGLVMLSPCIEVWQKLAFYVDSGAIDTTEPAAAVLERLENEYIQHRIAVRKAEARFKRVSDLAVPIPMKTRPWDHQARAIGFSFGLPATAVFMEQGTGKTFVGCALAGQRFLEGSVNRVLISTVKSAIDVWKQQLTQHCDFPFVVSAQEGPVLVPESDPGKLQIIVTNHDRVAISRKLLLKWKPDMVIIDESQKIQSRKGARSKALFAIGDRAKFRLCETGTPLAQNPLSIWSQFRFLNPDILGRSFQRFKERYCKLGGYMGLEVRGFQNLDELAEKIHSISFRCTKSECLDLPQEVTQRVMIDMDAASRRAYKQMDLEFIADIGNERIRVDRRVSAIAKLRQITSGMVKNDRGELLPLSQQKVSELRNLLQDRDWSRKAVVFTVFDHEMELVLDMSRKLGLSPLSLRGKTKDHGQVWRAFQSNETHGIIAVQIATGGAGIELTAANQAYYLSPTFSFLDDNQSRARLHRIGQRDPVTYSYLLMKKTVDEHVMDVLESAGDLSTELLDRKRDYQLQRSKLR